MLQIALSVSGLVGVVVSVLSTTPGAMQRNLDVYFTWLARHGMHLDADQVRWGLLFGSAIKHSTSVARDYGTNLLGAMVGGVAEYLSLATGFQFLLLVVAAFYVAAVLARKRGSPVLLPSGSAVHTGIK